MKYYDITEKENEKDKEMEMVAGMQTEIEALRFAISTIAEIIHMELPLRYQDDWLDRIVKQGLYVTPETEEILREQEQ